MVPRLDVLVLLRQLGASMMRDGIEDCRFAEGKFQSGHKGASFVFFLGARNDATLRGRGTQKL